MLTTPSCPGSDSHASKAPEAKLPSYFLWLYSIAVQIHISHKSVPQARGNVLRKHMLLWVCMWTCMGSFPYVICVAIKFAEPLSGEMIAALCPPKLIIVNHLGKCRHDESCPKPLSHCFGKHPKAEGFLLPAGLYEGLWIVSTARFLSLRFLNLGKFVVSGSPSVTNLGML